MYFDVDQIHTEAITAVVQPEGYRKALEALKWYLHNEMGCSELEICLDCLTVIENTVKTLMAARIEVMKNE